MLEKVEHPIVDALIGRPQFIDTIPEIISDRPSQFVSKVFELIQVSLTLRLNLLGLPIEPRKEQDRCLVIVVLIENYLGPWHTVSSPMFSDLRTSVKWLFRRQRNKWPFAAGARYRNLAAEGGVAHEGPTQWRQERARVLLLDLGPMYGPPGCRERSTRMVSLVSFESLTGLPTRS